jgi:hypothetical protein
MSQSKPTIYLASSYLADQELVKNIETELTKQGVEVVRAPTPYSDTPLKESDYCIAVIRGDFILGKGIFHEIDTAHKSKKCIIVIPHINVQGHKGITMFSPENTTLTLLRKDSYQEYASLKIKNIDKLQNRPYADGIFELAHIAKGGVLRRREEKRSEEGKRNIARPPLHEEYKRLLLLVDF